MNKILRYSFVALLAMMFAPSFAEDIIWQEDFSSYAADAVPAGGDYNYACENGGGTTKIYAANLAGGTAPELLVAKKQGSFSATIPLNGKSGEMMLTFLTNRNDLVVEITGATLGEKVRLGNADTYPVTVASGTASLTIKFYMSVNSNARLDNIKLYQGTAKQPAGLSWGKASTTVTFGEDYSSIPTLQNPNKLTVECTSDNEAACKVTNAGEITVVGAGDANISAAFAGNDAYEAQTVTIKITVKAAIDHDVKGQKNNPYLITDEEFLTLAGSLKPEDETSTSSSNPKSDKIYVKGYIVDIDDVTAADLEKYGNMTFKIAATKGDYDAAIKLKAYRCKYLENQMFTSADQIKKDDEVVICGQIQWYGGSPQFVSGCYIYSIENGAVATKYTITVTPAEHGSMTLDKYEAAEGEKVYVTEMKVDDGWEMNQPTITAENGADVEIGGSDEEGHYLVMPASNVTITLSITQLYTITPVFDSNKGDVRGISFDSEKSPIYKGAGKNVKFTVTAKEGFEIESVTAADADNTPITVNVAADKSYYEFEMPAKDVTITATFKEVQAEGQGQVWDFTQWSDETKSALIADAAASKTSGWSDVEKKADAEAGKDPTEVAKDNCFWFAGTANADGTLSANGVVIKELKGLKFDNADYLSARSLAIAVNYGTIDTSKDFGPYHGPSYLWLGGKEKKCFTIPDVAAGSKITIEAESHKITDARGIQLKQGDTQIGTDFKPTTFTSQEFTVTNAGDVEVWNTNGCHIYTIKIEAGAANISTIKVAAQNGAIYNLAGQKVGKEYKGIVIMNGKKFMQK